MYALSECFQVYHFTEEKTSIDEVGKSFRLLVEAQDYS